METLDPNPSVADQTLDPDLLHPYPGFYPIQDEHQLNLDGASGETAAIEGNEPGYDLKEEDYDGVVGSPYRQYPEINPDHRVLPSNSWTVQEESLEIIPTGVGAGLENLGNTCFINAILQCFTHTVPLVQALRSCNHLKTCQINNSEGFCALCTLIEHIDLSIASSGKVIAPTKLFDNLNYISSVFERYQQEDAHEFLQCLLDRLERCCLESQKVDTSLSSLAGNNLVEQIFGGRLVSKLQCCNCGHCSDTYEPLIDLSLEIEDVDSLQSALESFTKLEKIDDSETKFTCEKCEEVVSLEKQLKLDKAPSVAAFHLKRFKTDGSSIVKIDKHVEFPLELDLQPYSSGGENNVELKYHLYAIVEHTGFSPTYGHYFSYIRSSPETWHRLNDSRVTRVSEDYVLSQDAYILFYAKQGTAWFSSLLGDEKLCMDLSTSNLSPKSVLDNVDNDGSSYCAGVKANHYVANESRDFAVGNSAQFSGERSSCGEFNKVRDGVEGTYASQELGLRQDATDFKESNNNYSMINSSMTAQANKNHDGASYNEEILCTPSLWENKCDQGVEKVKSNDGFRPLTPPRSPSADDIGGPSETIGDQIPIEHMKLESQPKCRRKLEQDDGRKLERTEALRFVNKNMTGSRRLKLMAAVNDSPMNRKRKINSSLCGRTSPRSARRKHNHSSYTRRVTI